MSKTERIWSDVALNHFLDIEKPIAEQFIPQRVPKLNYMQGEKWLRYTAACSNSRPLLEKKWRKAEQK